MSLAPVAAPAFTSLPDGAGVVAFLLPSLVQAPARWALAVALLRVAAARIRACAGAARGAVRCAVLAAGWVAGRSVGVQLDVEGIGVELDPAAALEAARQALHWMRGPARTVASAPVRASAMQD